MHQNHNYDGAEAAAARGRVDADVRACLSIRRELSGCILITGGLGFLGSVVLESLLRNCNEVERVYLLVRDKKSLSAAQRVEKLLCGPLFHTLHQQVADGRSSPFQLVKAIEGDLCLPGLGLSELDRQLLLSTTTHVIHCAANIELDADIQWSLRHNYYGTQALMQLSSEMPQLRSFVHVSTFFVNNHMPRNSVVPEEIHAVPLELAGRKVQHQEYVEALMAMDNQAANSTVLALMGRNNFNSTYAFGKHLTELLVVDTPVRPGVQRAIVRPSLIFGLLGDPYPGYIAGYGGPSGYNLGYAVGFFQGEFSVAFSSDYMMDIIPCDVAAAVTIAAAAKTSSAKGTAAADQVPIYHACTAHCNPVSLGTIMDASARFWLANPPPLTLPGTRYPVFATDYKASEWGILLGRGIAWLKILAVSALMTFLGKKREATLLRNAYSAFSVYNTRRYDRSILSAVDSAIALRSELSPEERRLWTLVADSSVLDWYPYGYTGFAGMRRLLLKQDETSTAEGHFFKYQPPASGVAALGLHLAACSAEESTSSADSAEGAAAEVLVDVVHAVRTKGDQVQDQVADVHKVVPAVGAVPAGGY